ncbi:hypothetical protein FOZ63_024332 [Perkinsus olseni]|uniref:Protein kinase domain-containing protein n=1 Tax=Perkinsus olseni TaxID=32597 RepID=A0A7J6RCB0_PEROL|nr:hypothetical protein FOZ63_024332 [Perkinsus olseni]
MTPAATVGDPPVAAAERPCFVDEMFPMLRSADGCRLFDFPMLPYLPKPEPPPTPKVEKSEWEIKESKRVEALFAKYAAEYKKKKKKAAAAAAAAAAAEKPEKEKKKPQGEVRPPQLVVHREPEPGRGSTSMFCANGAMLLARVSPPRPEHEMDCDSDFAIGSFIPSPCNRSVEYHVLDKLGEGSFGNVYLCSMSSIYRGYAPRKVAMKVLKNNSRHLKHAVFEARALEVLSRAFNIAKPVFEREKQETAIVPLPSGDMPEFETPFLEYFDSFVFKCRPCIVAEFIDMTLLDMIRQTCDGSARGGRSVWGDHRPGLPLKVVAHIGEQVMQQMVLMRLLGIVHCDVKLDNVLIRSAPDGEPIWKVEAKLADLGCAMFERDPIHKHVQSRYNRSPEAILGLHPYGCAIDMWSIGCMFVEMATRQPLFQSVDELHQLNVITSMLGPIPFETLNDAVIRGRGERILDFYEKLVIVETAYYGADGKFISSVRHIEGGQASFIRGQEWPLPLMYYSISSTPSPWQMLLNYEMPGRDFLEQWSYVQRWIGLEEAAVHPGLPHHAMQRRVQAYRLRFPGEGPESRINIVTTGPEANGGDELTVDVSHMMTRPTGVAAVLQAKNVEGASKEKSEVERNWSEALAACFTWAPEDRITPAQMLSSPFITEANEVDESGKFWREKTDTEVLEMFYGEKDGFLRKAAERMVEKDVVVETFEDFKNYLEEVGYRWTKEFRRLRKAMPQHGQLPPSYPGLDFGPLTGVDEDMESDLSISTEDCSTINTVTAGLPMPSPVRGNLSCGW